MAPATSEHKRIISTTTIRPSPAMKEVDDPFLPLSPWDLVFLSHHYTQNGLLFHHKLPGATLVATLVGSLAGALAAFYSFAGRLVTRPGSSPSSVSPPIHCNGAGVEFVHADADGLSVADVGPDDVPMDIVYSLFPLNGAVNHEGHRLPLLAVQLTELRDGFFLGCSVNHAVADGAALWHFFNSWAEIARTKAAPADISRPQVFMRRFPELPEAAPVDLPFSDLDQFIENYELPPIKDFFFHFSDQSIAELKRRARTETQNDAISSFQVLYAVVWRAVVRAWRSLRATSPPPSLQSTAGTDSPRRSLTSTSAT